MPSVDVFADQACTQLLAQMTVSAQFAPESADFSDGEDWWNQVIAEVEQTHGSRWQSLVVRSLDGQQGRRFNRHNATPLVTPVFRPRVFAFSKSVAHSSFENLTTSKSRLFDLSQFDFGAYYLDSTDERIIQQLASVFACVHQQFSNVLVLDPTATLTQVQLNQQFEAVQTIELKDQSDYLALADFDASMNQLYQMKLEAEDIHASMQDLTLTGSNHAKNLTASLSDHLAHQFAQFQKRFSLS